MKLKEYINGLQEFAKENEGSLEMDVYTSIDDEGNGYNMVYFTPSIGRMDDGEFEVECNIEEADSVVVN